MTAGEGHTIRELGGEPALPALREAIEGLAPSERAMIANGLLLGIVLDGAARPASSGPPRRFLVRGLIGADPEAGTVAVGAAIAARDRRAAARARRGSADRDLREALGLRREALGGQRPAGRAGLHLQRARARGVRRARPRRQDARPGAGRRAGRAASSRRARSGRSAARRSCTGSPPPWQSSRLEPRRPQRPAHRRDRRHRPRDRAPAARAGATLVLTGRRTDVLGPLAARRRPRGGGRPDGRRGGRAPGRRRARGVDVLVANAGLPGSGPLLDYGVDEIDRALAVNLRAPMVLSAAARRADGRARQRPHRASSRRCRASSPARAARSTARRSSACAASARRCAATCAHGVGVSVVFPGFIRDAGMFHMAGVELPRSVGTSTPDEVADGVLSAIERDRGEVDVAPLGMRWAPPSAASRPAPRRRSRAAWAATRSRPSSAPGSASGAPSAPR